MGSFDRLAEVYEAARHGYPLALRDHLVSADALRSDAVVVDLGAGTGQLAILAATISSNVIAIDPEPDMVRVGSETTKEEVSIRWLIGRDSDLPDVLDSPVDLVLVGNAFHHMDQRSLLTSLDALMSPTGVVVVCSSSIPVWLQNAEWSVALRHALSAELDRDVGRGGTPDHQSDHAVLRASTFSDVDEWIYERTQPRSGESIIGEIVSSASGAINMVAADRLRSALDPYLTNGTLIENVKTTALIAKRPMSE